MVNRTRDSNDNTLRTDEYYQFMDQLEKYLKNKGITLQREPVLGGKRLDLHLIYKMVIEAGGFDKVTQERGWRKVGAIFNLPPTCTNSAFVIKNLYSKYLYTYEQEMVFRRKVDVKPQSVNTPRTLRSADNPPVQPVTPKPAMKPAVFNSEPRFPPPPKIPVSSTPLSLPISNVIQQTIRKNNERAHIVEESGPRNKLFLSLQSNLPNEVEWAYSQLVKLSFTRSHQLILSRIPGLLNYLLKDALNLIAKFITDKSVLLEESLFNTTISNNYEKLLQIMHILANLSYVEHNSNFIMSNPLTFSAIITILSECSDKLHVELQHYCLDIIENGCSILRLRAGQQETILFLQYLKGFVTSQDRGLQISSLRILVKLGSIEQNERIISEIIVKDILGVLSNFLLLDQDDVLLIAVTDCLYQFTSFKVEFVRGFTEHLPLWVIQSLIRFLPNNQCPKMESPQLPALQENPKEKAPVQASQQSFSSESTFLSSLKPRIEQLNEPYRAAAWLKLAYSQSPDGSVLQSVIYSNYISYCSKPDAKLSLEDFMKVIHILYPGLTLCSVDPSQTSVILLKGISSLYGRSSVTSSNDLNHTSQTSKENVDSTNVIEVDDHQGQQVVAQSSVPNLIIPAMNRPNNSIPFFGQRIVEHDDLLAGMSFDLYGIPLTCLLILRNLARISHFHSEFKKLEPTLLTHLRTYPNLLKYGLQIINEYGGPYHPFV